MLYSLIKIVGNRSAGFILTLVVVVNLAIGSLVMNFNPDLYPPFFPFDLNYFFDPVRPVHFWLYGLIATFTLFSLNLSACLVESIVELLQSQGQRLKRCAALLIHIALLLTMAAHLYDGFYGQTQQGTITSQGVNIPGIGLVHAKSVQNFYHPDDSLKETEATLSMQLTNGEKLEKTIAYNEPAIFDGGIWEIIIQSGQNQPSGIVLIDDANGKEIKLAHEQSLRLAGGFLTLSGIVSTQVGPFAQLSWKPFQGPRVQQFIALNPNTKRHNSIMLSGERYRFKEMLMEPIVAVMVRYNPAIALVILALVISAVGLILLAPQWGTRTE